MVHEGIITNHSKFFEATCGRPWKEATERIIRLPEEEPSNFETYMHWVYAGIVRPIAQEAFESALADDNNDCIPQCWLTLVGELAELYTIADRLDDRGLRNAIIDSILNDSDRSQLGPTVSAIQIAYSATAAGSMLRKLMVDYLLRSPDEHRKSWLEATRESLPDDFIFDIALSAGAEPESPSLGSRCEYHEHEEGTPGCT